METLERRKLRAVRRFGDGVCSPGNRAYRLSKGRSEMSAATRGSVIFGVVLVCASLAIAQTPQGPAQGAPQGAGQAVGQGAGGRGGVPPRPVVIGPSAPVPPEVTIPRPTPDRARAGQRGAAQVHRQRRLRDQTAVEEIRVADVASAAALERRRDLYTNHAAAGTATRGLRRDRQAGQYRPAPARRLDHRLVAAERREQGGIPQVLRRASGPPTSRSPAIRRKACCGA